MIPVNTIDFTSIEEIKSNPEKYKNIYFKDKIIVFRNANLNKAEQTDLMRFFGDILGWFPNSQNSNTPSYVETHHRNMVDGVGVGKDQLILNWHLEHVHDQEDPHMGATWRMEKFLCDEESGRTFFVDMAKMFKDLNKDDQDFLSRCITKVDSSVVSGETTIKVIKKFDSVNAHPVTGENTIRISVFSPDGKLNSLSTVDGRNPTKEEYDRYNKLIIWICNEVWNNEDIRMVLKWKQGDLAIPDLYKLAHSVSGGFDKDQRLLSGNFGKLKPW